MKQLAAIRAMLGDLHARAGAQVTGCDIAPNWIEKARTAAQLATSGLALAIRTASAPGARVKVVQAVRNIEIKTAEIDDCAALIRHLSRSAGRNSKTSNASAEWRAE